MLKNYLFVFLLIVIYSGTYAQGKIKADLIVTNARVYTADNKFEEAESFAVRKGIFVGVGSTLQILNAYTSDSIIDAAGKFVYPGFIDAHSHFLGYSLGLSELNLTGLRSFGEVTDLLIANRNVYPGTWIVGRGWDQNLWDKKQFPDRSELDVLFPDRPVVLIRVDGHVLLANGEALRRANILSASKFLPGEAELRNGQMTGILSENAADSMREKIPLPTREELLSLLRRAQSDCFSKGLTGVADAGLDYPVVTFLDSLQQQHILKMRLYVMLNPSAENIQNFINEGQYITPYLTVRSIKLYADGTLGSRTALLKNPYSDDQTKQGIQVTPPQKIREICSLAMEKGYQVNTHAIGDSAVSEILNIYGDFLKGKNDLRWRIEHAQVVDPRDIYLFGEYSIIPSVQATHATSDMYWAANRLGKNRIKWAYAYHNLLEQNGWIPNGTDFPVEGINPLLTFYASIARQDIKGYPENGFQMENALTRPEALRSITIWAARAGFQEVMRGSIERGKFADFVILDNDIMTCPVREILSVKVIMTYVGGERVY